MIGVLECSIQNVDMAQVSCDIDAVYIAIYHVLQLAMTLMKLCSRNLLV